MSLLDRRLVVVTGKGGVGKTTVAAALGLLAARRGKHVILCDLNGQTRLPRLFGVSPDGGVARRVAAGVSAISIDADSAEAEWLGRQLRSGMLAGILGRSSFFQLLTAAAPGLAELATIGKVWDLAQPEARTDAGYDLAILDAPPTGHGLALLTAPRTYANVARVGPIHRQALQIDRFLRHRASTALLGVAMPEEMPVNETIELEARLSDNRLSLDAVVVNGLYPERFTSAEAERVRALDGRVPPGARATLRLACSEYGRARAQRSQLRRLRRGLRAPVTTLPFLFEPVLGPPEIELLSRDLERAL
ncbi:MAG TPA: ArsA-related P-loop ATPase [Thermoleophilaceae bacterium]